MSDLLQKFIGQPIQHIFFFGRGVLNDALTERLQLLFKMQRIVRVGETEHSIWVEFGTEKGGIGLLSDPFVHFAKIPETETRVVIHSAKASKQEETNVDQNNNVAVESHTLLPYIVIKFENQEIVSVDTKIVDNVATQKLNFLQWHQPRLLNREEHLEICDQSEKIFDKNDSPFI